MVAVSPNPAPAFYFFDPLNSMGLPGLNSPPSINPAPPFSSTAAGSAGSFVEDPSKKIRKPYTITKSRESWTDQEHDKFLEALQLFDRDWKKIEAFVGSKNVIQIRSHAQKYFLKVQKSGTSEHLPPPRPKRKASHPYPQKVSKNALSSQVARPSTLLEPSYVHTKDSSSMLGNPMISAASWNFNSVPSVSISQETKDAVLAGPTIAQNCGYSRNNEGRHMTWPVGEEDDQGDYVRPARGLRDAAMPDFVLVYSFLASVFDPDATGHLKRLKLMDPINSETVLLLMKNLSFNLTSPNFEDHKRLLSSHDAGCDSAQLAFANDTLNAVKSEGAALPA